MPVEKIIRPKFPEGYLEAPSRLLDWPEVEARLAEAIHYWVCSVTPSGRPHAVPKWGVWVEEHFYFDGSPETKHARNLALNPAVTLHLESGEQALIVNGTCRALAKPEPSAAETIAREYRRKYAALGYAPQADQWDNGGLFEISPRSVLTWTRFTEDPTKFIFSE
jgi:nitroimidazol reductase NimA-like FMN-containing flavoprotein (pyridoxamine 5'-phosphate oxidase superfamily)